VPSPDSNAQAALHGRGDICSRFARALSAAAVVAYRDLVSGDTDLLLFFEEL
jgi:hypothetical protein